MGTWTQAVRRHFPLLLVTVFLLAPVLFLPGGAASESTRPLLMQLAASVLVVLLLARLSWSPEGIRRFLTTGPNLALILLLGWAVLSYALMAPVGTRSRDLALAELLRLACAGAIYFAVAYRCGSRDNLKLAVNLLLGAAIMASLAAAVSYAQSSDQVARAAFANPQFLAAFLVMLLPISVVFAVQGEMNARRMTAIATVVMVAAALMLTQNRSAWIGAAAGLLVVALLLWKTGDAREWFRSRHLWVAPVLGIALAGGLFLGLNQDAVRLADHRARTLQGVSTDKAFQWRWDSWIAGWNLALDRPLTGWGPGVYPLAAPRYGSELERVESVERHGPGLLSVPHNEYVQKVAELGFVGLGLYLLILVGFFFRGLTALSRVRGDTRKWLLVAAMGGVAAQAVDAIGNPGWGSMEVAPLLWVVLGLGMAAARSHRERQEEPEAVVVRAPIRRAGRLSWQLASGLCGVSLAVASVAGAQSGDVGLLTHEPPDYKPHPTILVVHPQSKVLNFGRLRRNPIRPYRLVAKIKNVGNRGTFLRGSAKVFGPQFRIGGNPNFRLAKGQTKRLTVLFLANRRSFEEPHRGLLVISHNDEFTRPPFETTIRLVGRVR